ncbi:MAG TPA: hypothetical protein VGO48_17300 [Conexibacter sp.]|nr:hypothetical protein [Conexibacter sp.]
MADDAAHRPVRRQLIVAGTCLAIGGGVVLVPRALTPAASAVVVAPVPGALRSVAVAGGRAGPLRARANVTTLGISSAVGTRTRAPRSVELIVPVPRASCARLERRLAGRCGASAGRALTGRDAVLDAAEPVLVKLTAPGHEGFFMEGDGRLASLAPNARRATVRVFCLSPQPLRLTVSNRSELVPAACSPQHAAVSFRLLLASRTRPRVDMVAARTLHVASPARSVRVQAASPTLGVGDRVETLLDRGDSVVTLTPANAGTIAIDRADVGDRPTVRISVPRADSVRVHGRGEQLQSLYDEHGDVWLGLTGLFVGIALSQLADLIVERRR